MITFKKDSFVIEIPTAGNPIEEYLNLQQELLEIMKCHNEELELKAWHTLNLLQEMALGWENALKMFYVKDEDLDKLKKHFFNKAVS